MLSAFGKLAFLSPTRSVHSFTKECLAWHLTSNPPTTVARACGILGSWWQQLLPPTPLPFHMPGVLVCLLLFEGKGPRRISGESLGGQGGLMHVEGRETLASEPQTKLSMKIGRGSWSLASRKAASALCLRLWDLKCSFVFFPLLTQTTTWQVSQPLRSWFFFLGVAVLPPLEVELMGLLCVEGTFPFLAFVYFCLETFLVPIVRLSPQLRPL